MLAGIGVGGAAVIVAGGAGLAAVDRSARPQIPPAPGVTITSGQLRSAHMGRSVGWSIALPTRPPVATIYCLHGFNSDHRFAFDQIHLASVVGPLQTPLAVAAVDGGADSYWHQRSDGTDAMAMVLDEFIPFVESRTKTSDRALLGWSMGGYGALLLAERAAEHFVAVAAASPALWTSAGQTAPGAFDSAADYQRFDVFAARARLAGLNVRIDCGTGDPFYRATKQFVSGLPPGPAAVFGPGGHDAAYWRRVAPAQVEAIASAVRAGNG